jgi:hypothetical protein
MRSNTKIENLFNNLNQKSLMIESTQNESVKHSTLKILTVQKINNSAKNGCGASSTHGRIPVKDSFYWEKVRKRA